MRVVFMGTPDFGMPCLKALCDNHEVVGVFTQPDKPKGRKLELTAPPIKAYAIERGYNVFQPIDIKSQNAYEYLKFLKPDVIVVVAYGQILPKRILELPRYGCINVHASLLPRHRGASPIQWAIVCGDSHTGVSTMLMNEGLDTGDIIEMSKLDEELRDIENAGVLHDKLSCLGSSLILSTLKSVEDGTAVFTKQDDSMSSYAPILTKEMGKIDWSKAASEIECRVRGLSPWPVSHTTWNGKFLKIFKVEVKKFESEEMNSHKAGEVLIVDDARLSVKAGDAIIDILEVQLEGKKRMDIASFLRGNKPIKGDILGG